MMNDANDLETQLDRLQIKWVLGRNRGDECPLSSEELGLLIDKGRLNWKTLTAKEREVFKDEEVKVKNWQQKRERKFTIKEIARMVGVLVEELKKQAYNEMTGQMDSVNWQEFTDSDKEKFAETMFRYKYGLSSFMLRRSLIKRLMQ